jgi:hypothetical protein
MQKYYTSEEPLKLKEYGRIIQNMVAYARNVKDEKERLALVHDIVRIMTLLNPSLKENPDFKYKLWDHLYFLAEFDPKVQTEIPMPEPELVYSRPKSRMPYYNAKSRFRAYGHTIELFVEQAIKIQDPAERKALVTIICNMMKVSIKGTDRDATVEETVMEHLNILSNGKLRYKPEDINFSKVNPTALAGSMGGPIVKTNQGQQRKPQFQQSQQKKSFGFANKKKYKK